MTETEKKQCLDLCAVEEFVMNQNTSAFHHVKIRLVDYEKMTHEQCAKQMDISRTTVTEIYESAREKIADAIINGRSFKIEGGNYRFCDGTARCCKKDCRFRIDGADVFADV